MAGNLLPLILVGGVVVALGGKKKKKKKSKSVTETKPEAKQLPPATSQEVPEGFGVGTGATEESDLEFEDEPTGDEAGEFEEKIEELEEGEEDVFGEPVDPAQQAHQVHLQVNEETKEMREKCNAFISEIHVIPTDPDEGAINSVAVEQSILPAMKASAYGLHQNLGIPYDEETMTTPMVLSALEAVAPECGWEYSDASKEFRYAGGLSAHEGKAGDILNALFDLTVMILDDFREGQQVEPQEAQFQAQSQEAQFQG